ncbi:MAG: type II toxin-antitoxin system HicB family antitoxin [Verrucomicrobiae bacterium]|nr:type II toxin-antitoxin system HicB family antitoxin [Verrucomicrobiae bacterium]
MKTQYEMIVYWSQDDGCYVVEVPELPGCMADGPTPVEAVKCAEKIISEWILTAHEAGRPIPKPKGRLMYA